MMKASRISFTSLSILVMAFVAILCSLATARNYARLIRLPTHQFTYNNQYYYDPWNAMNEIIHSPINFNKNANGQQEVSEKMNRLIPSYSVSEDNGMMQLEIEIPGVQYKDVEIHLEDSTHVRIKGRRAYKRSDGTFDDSKFDVVFRLKENVDTSQLKASLSAGILRVQVPHKVKEIKPIRIEHDNNEESVTMSYEYNVNGNLPSLSTPHDTSTIEIVDGMTITSEANA
jgi:HSP20 family protein